MSVKTIDRAGISAWSPIAAMKSMIAVGGVGSPSTSDFNVKVELEIYTLDSGSRVDSLGLLCNEKVNHGFRAIAWADVGPACPAGIIAGGLSNGSVCLWDASRLMNSSHSTSSSPVESGSSSLLFSQHLHGDRAVSCMEFNPQKQTLLATGGCDGMVQVASIERPHQAEIFKGVTTTKHANTEVLCVSWNRKVQHILASASNQGLIVVWDLKNKKEVVTIKDPGNRTRPSSLSWNPDVPTQLLVAYNDDSNPCIQLWDMRNCSYPFREFQEHTRGLTAASFCDLDSNLIVSSGRDNRGVCWSLHSGQLDTYSDLNLSSPATKLDWSPHLPGFIAASQSSGMISIHTISQRQTSVAAKHPPKWIRMPCGVSFGFGGKLVTFGSRQAQGISIHVIPDEPAVVSEADKFEQYLATDLRPFCNSRAADAQDDHEKLTWNLISLLFEGPAARQQIIGAMGLNTEEVQGLAEKYLGRQANVQQAKPVNQQESTSHRPDSFADAGNLDADQLDDLFDQLAKNSEQNATGALSAVASRRGSPRAMNNDADAEMLTTDWSQGPEAIIKNSILIGDITTAVDCCMKCGRFADALFIAAAGDDGLRQRVRNEYSRRQRDPFIRLIGYVLGDELEKFVQHSDLNAWIETLVLLVTYSRPENYSDLVEMLAERLEKERFDVRSAVLCYLACGSFSNTVRIWASMSHTQGSQSQALQGLVEKMSCLFTAVRPAVGDPVFSHKMQQYATLLANSGRIIAAMRCLILVPDSTETRILKDRIYNAAPSAMGQLLRSPPPFPFEAADIRPLPTAPLPSRAAVSSMYGGAQGQPSFARTQQPQMSGPPPSRPGFTQPALGIPSQGLNGNIPNQGSIPGRLNSAPVPPPTTISPMALPSTSPPVVSPPTGNMPNPWSGSSPASFAASDPSQMMGAQSSNVQIAPKISRPPTAIPQRAPSPAISVTTPAVSIQQRPTLHGYGTSPKMQPPANSQQRSLPTAPHVIPSQPSMGEIQTPSTGWSYIAPDPQVSNCPPIVPQDMSYRPVTGPPTSGGVSTAPHATANPVTPGLPTSWPVPTPVQQQLSPGIVPPPKSAMLAPVTLNDPVPQNEVAVVQQSITGLLERCAQDGNRRKWDDIGKKLHELYEKLANGQISRESVVKIKEMCQCIDRGDFVSASRLRVELSASDWEKNRTWLFAVQLLLPK